MSYRVFRSEQYDKKLEKLDKNYKKQVEKFEQELKKKPHRGDPLGYKFFREKKFNGKRLYYLIYEKHEVVFLITMSGKKVQKETIEMIKSNLEIYKKAVEEVAENL